MFDSWGVMPISYRKIYRDSASAMMDYMDYMDYMEVDMDYMGYKVEGKEVDMDCMEHIFVLYTLHNIPQVDKL